MYAKHILLYTEPDFKLETEHWRIHLSVNLSAQSTIFGNVYLALLTFYVMQHNMLGE